MQISRRLLRAAPLAVAAGTLALSACGGSSATVAPTTAPTASVDTTIAGSAADSTATSVPGNGQNGGRNRLQLTDAQRSQLTAYAACLSSHGLDIPFLTRLASGQGFTGGSRPTRAAGDTSPTRAPGDPGVPGDGAGGPPGGFGGGGTATTIDQKAFAAADAACADKRPTGIDVQQLLQRRGGPGGGGGFGGAAFRAYTSCLADHGVKVVTPTTTTGDATATTVAGAPGAGGGRSTFDRNDPNFAAANEACKALLPAGPGGAGGPVSTTTTAGI